MAQAELQAMTTRTYFENWDTFVDQEWIDRSRAIIQETLKELIALGDNSSENEQMPILEQCIESFNDLDVEADMFIMTTEREDICEVFDQIVEACGIEAEDLADEWRDF